MVKKKTNLEEIAMSLGSEAGGDLGPEAATLVLQLLRLVAKGRPISREEIATAFHIPSDSVTFGDLPWEGSGPELKTENRPLDKYLSQLRFEGRKKLGELSLREIGMLLN